MPAHDIPKIVAIAGQRIGMLSHAATSIADLGKDTDGAPTLPSVPQTLPRENKVTLVNRLLRLA